MGGCERGGEEMDACDEVVGLRMLMRRRQAADTAGEREGGRRISARSRAEESMGKEKVIATDRYRVAAAGAGVIQAQCS